MSLQTPRYEEQFVAFIDLLGFAEAMADPDEIKRGQVLKLLKSFAERRGEFEYRSSKADGGGSITVRPAVSAFSDHVVISYLTHPLIEQHGEGHAAFAVEAHFSLLLAEFAAAALKIGFLIRGGATIGRLHHGDGIVFGEALVEAFRLESNTAIYPRVVMSNRLSDRKTWFHHKDILSYDQDGVAHFNYVQELILGVWHDGPNRTLEHRAWYESAVEIINRNLSDLKSAGKIQQFSKWAWLSSKMRDEMSELRKKRPALMENAGLLHVPLTRAVWP